jgi:hypothetical protein
MTKELPGFNVLKEYSVVKAQKPFPVFHNRRKMFAYEMTIIFLYKLDIRKENDRGILLKKLYQFCLN